MKKRSIVFLAIFFFSFQLHAMKGRRGSFWRCLKRCGSGDVRMLLAKNNYWRLRSGMLGWNCNQVSSIVSFNWNSKRFYAIQNTSHDDELLEFDVEQFDKYFNAISISKKRRILNGINMLEKKQFEQEEVAPIINDLVYDLIAPNDLNAPQKNLLKQIIAKHSQAALNEVDTIYDFGDQHIKERTWLGKGIVYSVAGLTALNVIVSFGVLVLAVVYVCYPELLGEKKEHG